MKFIDLTGQTFGRLTVIDRGPNNRQNRPKWNCLCECGTKTIVDGQSLRTGNTRSCECLRKEEAIQRFQIHGMRNSPEWASWSGMKQRCSNPKNPNYKQYGARGITLCDKWNTFAGFFEDMGKRPTDTHTLERIDNDGNYEPSNCRWASRKTQARNRRLMRNNSTGISGVYQRSSKSWRAAIRVSGKRVNLYSGPDFFEACCSRKSAESKYWGAV